MDLMKALTSQYMKQELPEVQVGDTVRVHVKVKDIKDDGKINLEVI